VKILYTLPIKHVTSFSKNPIQVNLYLSISSYRTMLPCYNFLSSYRPIKYISTYYSGSQLLLKLVHPA